MTNKESLQRFILEEASIRGEYIFLQKSFQTIIHQHPYPESIRRLLGEALCVAGLLSAIIKFKGRLTVQFRGKGALKLLLVQCNNQFHLRALAKWEGELSYPELMHAFEDGVLAIMLDSTVKSGNYQGIVSWTGDSFVSSIENYFAVSEQLKTKIWLSVNETTAAGFLLQVIPSKKNSDEDWSRIITKANTIQTSQLLSNDYPEFLKHLFPDETVRVFEATPVKFKCSCSRKRCEDAIRVLGQAEAEAEIKNKNSLMVTCDFCNKEYVFDKVDVAKIFANTGGSTNIQLH